MRKSREKVYQSDRKLKIKWSFARIINATEVLRTGALMKPVYTCSIDKPYPTASLFSPTFCYTLHPRWSINSTSAGSNPKQPQYRLPTIPSEQISTQIIMETTCRTCPQKAPLPVESGWVRVWLGSRIRRETFHKLPRNILAAEAWIGWSADATEGSSNTIST